MLGVLAIQAVDDILIVMLSFVSFVVLDDTLFIHTGHVSCFLCCFQFNKLQL